MHQVYLPCVPTFGLSALSIVFARHQPKDSMTREKILRTLIFIFIPVFRFSSFSWAIFIFFLRFILVFGQSWRFYVWRRCEHVASRMFRPPSNVEAGPRPPCYPSSRPRILCPSLYRHIQLRKVSGGARREEWYPPEVAWDWLSQRGSGFRYISF